jgi:SAM-dependent methyltransferase
VVLEDLYTLPFADDSVDICLSSSVFEHSEMFWLLFVEILRILKPGGLFYLNAPSNGDFHRYPVDCWRFYPDSGQALVAWARRCGITATLLESFVAVQRDDVWNDFVAVFAKGEAVCDANFRSMIGATQKGFYNGRVLGQDGFVNFRAEPEDRLKLLTIEQIAAGKLRVS